MGLARLLLASLWAATAADDASLVVRDWSPGAVVEGYELVERTALLGVCNHVESAPQCKSLSGGGSRKAVVAIKEGGKQVAVVEVAADGALLPVVTRRETEAESGALVPEGPSLEYQCLLEDIDLIYVNSNYRLKKKFAAGSHGEVWRATRRNGDTHESFILKRLFVERGEMMVEMGLREAHFGKLLANEAHVTRFVEYFFRGTHAHHTNSEHTGSASRGQHSRARPRPPPLPASPAGDESPHPATTDPHAKTHELWLVFYDEGISLRHYLYSSRESAHAAVVFEPSPFWHKLRMDTHGEEVLREIMRQLLEGVASLHDRGITHRDIKPSNVLVHLQRLKEDENPKKLLTTPIVKLADFGSAVDDHTFRHLYGERGPTQAEETREYQAPEVLFSEFGVPYDFAYPLAYDMWSVGVVFLEMVLGSPQVFMISPRARAKLDVKLRGKDEATRLKSYLLHVFTHEFCIYQPSPHELHTLWQQHALVSDSCHFGRFNTTIVERDPMRTGLRNRWGLDLMWKLLQWNPSDRITARAALDHAFFKGPYTCGETGRQFATRAELKTHQSYLAIQKAREREFAFMVREKYDLPNGFRCPHCHRKFSTIHSCEQHLVARKHHALAGSHFCDHDRHPLRQAIRQETARSVGFPKLSSLVATRVGVALLQGKKKYMEDEVVVHRFEPLNLTVYAVIDGHLGTGAADFVRAHLVTTCIERLKTLKEAPFFDKTQMIERVLMRQLFLELHNSFLASSNTTNDVDFSGCTLTLVVHFEDEGRLLSANVGDSRAIFVSGSDVYPLSMDHWPDVEAERRRIESSGGFISFEGLWRVVGQLAVSRSIGDRHLRQYVTAEPSIFSLRLGDVVKGGHGLVVIASDGVWDTMDNRDVVDFIADSINGGQSSLQHVAVDLVQEAFLRGSLDNLAAILIDVGHA